MLLSRIRKALAALSHRLRTHFSFSFFFFSFFGCVDRRLTHPQGSGGGPLESNVTAFLVRSLASGWSKGSVVAVDAGVHLSAITRILEQSTPADLGKPDGTPLPYTIPKGPFAGLQVPHARPDANAAHIFKNLIETFLITHPHLDHISGFVINTAGPPGARPKRIAGLPCTINALKTHVFNNVIWPNLSDENNGAGLVTYMRLVEGGSPALGEGEGKGYVEVCDGLAVKVWSVSHGHCIERHSHRGSISTRHNSFDAAASVGPSTGSLAAPSGAASISMLSPARNPQLYTSAPPSTLSAFLQQQERMQSSGRRGSPFSSVPPADESICVYDSSAYFLRDVATGREILIFGDVEPDSISLSPRNRQIWQEAAPKVVSGKLVAIFIECSFDDSQTTDRLFGHLTPRFIFEEMSALAEEVLALRRAEMVVRDGSCAGCVNTDKKRKRGVEDEDDGAVAAKRRSTPTPQQPPREMNHHHLDVPVSPKTRHAFGLGAADTLPKCHPPIVAAATGRNPRSVPSPSSPKLDGIDGDVDVDLPDNDGADMDVLQTENGHDHDHDHDESEEGVSSLYDGALSSVADTTAASTAVSTPLTGTSLAPAPAPAQEGGITSHPRSSCPQQQRSQQENMSISQPQPSQPSQPSQPQGQTFHPTADLHTTQPYSLEGVLRGLKVVIIHVKGKMCDGLQAEEVISEELMAHEREKRLGCEFVVSRFGQEFLL